MPYRQPSHTACSDASERMLLATSTHRTGAGPGQRPAGGSGCVRIWLASIIDGDRRAGSPTVCLATDGLTWPGQTYSSSRTPPPPRFKNVVVVERRNQAACGRGDHALRACERPGFASNAGTVWMIAEVSNAWISFLAAKNRYFRRKLADEEADAQALPFIEVLFCFKAHVHKCAAGLRTD